MAIKRKNNIGGDCDKDGPKDGCCMDDEGGCKAGCDGLTVDLSGLYDNDGGDEAGLSCEGNINDLFVGGFPLALVPGTCGYEYCKEDIDTSQLQGDCARDDDMDGIPDRTSVNLRVFASITDPDGISKEGPHTYVSFQFYAKVITGEGEDQICRTFIVASAGFVGAGNACDDVVDLKGSIPEGQASNVKTDYCIGNADSGGDCLCSTSTTKKSSEDKTGDDTTSADNDYCFIQLADASVTVGTVGPGGGTENKESTCSDDCPPKDPYFWIFADCCAQIVTDPFTDTAGPDLTYAVYDDGDFDFETVYELAVDVPGAMFGEDRYVCATPYSQTNGEDGNFFLGIGPKARPTGSTYETCEDCLQGCAACTEQYADHVELTFPFLNPNGIEVDDGGGMGGTVSCQYIVDAYNAKVAGKKCQFYLNHGGCSGTLQAKGARKEFTYTRENNCDSPSGGDSKTGVALFSVVGFGLDGGSGNYYLSIQLEVDGSAFVMGIAVFQLFGDPTLDCQTGEYMAPPGEGYESTFFEDVPVKIFGKSCGTEKKGMRVAPRAKSAKKSRRGRVATVVAKASKGCNDWKGLKGSREWAALHRFARKAKTAAEFAAYVADLLERIKCEECKEKFAADVAANPPPDKLEDAFDWTVDRHNTVNHDLGKPVVSYDAATTLYPPHRSCDSCTLCCTLKGITELKKPNFQKCEHECAAGCAIYELKPKSCTDYGCSWQLGYLPAEVRPLDCGFMLDYVERTINVFETVPGALVGFVANGMATLTQKALDSINTMIALKKPRYVRIYLPRIEKYEGISIEAFEGVVTVLRPYDPV